MMKKVSARVFFAVVWRGLRQALGWFFGLFGYKRDGRFAKCVWGLFATSAAVVMAMVALTAAWAVGEKVYHAYDKRYGICNDGDCYADEYVFGDIYFHNHDDGKGYVYDRHTGEIYLKRVAWIAKPEGKDSLVCYSDGKKRGYFSKNTGRVVIEPKYSHAWIFSDGLASVEENGHITFIDATGKVVIDKRMAYIAGMDGYVFHGGYCVVNTDDGEQYGLMDKKGNIVLPLEYSSIQSTDDFEFWEVQKDKETAVLDSRLQPVLPLTECSVFIGDGTIDVTLPDHTMRKYDTEGNLIYDFYIYSVRSLEYEKDELLYRTRTHDDNGVEYGTPFVEEYRPRGIARLHAYVAGDGYEGLMTADGHVVTQPLYKTIEAIANDLYLCTSTNYDKVIVDGKGKIVR